MRGKSLSGDCALTRFRNSGHCSLGLGLGIRVRGTFPVFNLGWFVLLGSFFGGVAKVGSLHGKLSDAFVGLRNNPMILGR